MRKEDTKTGQRIILTENAEHTSLAKAATLKPGMKGTIIRVLNMYRNNQTIASNVVVEFDDYIGASVRTMEGSSIGKEDHCQVFSSKLLIEIAKVCRRKNNY